MKMLQHFETPIRGIEDLSKKFMSAVGCGPGLEIDQEENRHDEESSQESSQEVSNFTENTSSYSSYSQKDQDGIPTLRGYQTDDSSEVSCGYGPSKDQAGDQEFVGHSNQLYVEVLPYHDDDISSMDSGSVCSQERHFFEKRHGNKARFRRKKKVFEKTSTGGRQTINRDRNDAVYDPSLPPAFRASMGAMQQKRKKNAQRRKGSGRRDQPVPDGFESQLRPNNMIYF